MNWNSQLGIGLYLAVATGVLSAGQAWVLGTASGRRPRYLVAWIASSAMCHARKMSNGSIRSTRRMPR